VARPQPPAGEDAFSGLVADIDGFLGVLGVMGRALPALPARIDAKRKISSNSKYLFALRRGFWQVTGSAVEPSATMQMNLTALSKANTLESAGSLRP
jgi:hypothetical protein